MKLLKRRKSHHTFFSAALAAALLVSSAQAATVSLDRTAYTTGDISGEAMMAINTSLSTTEAKSGTFTVSEPAQASLQNTEAQAEDGTQPGVEVSRIDYDEETGTTSEMLSIRFETPECARKAAPLLASQSGEAFSYQVGDTKSILDGVSDISRTMECLVVGEHCTVWGCTEDAAAAEDLMLSTENAQAIADQFDSVCGSMTDAFGEWLDADEDGKLAIFCYDIEQDYTNTTGNIFSGKYYGGFFQPSNLINPTTHRVGNFYDTPSDYSYGMDCIHIDVFPLMGGNKTNLFSAVNASYSTLFHETQHLVETSYCLLGDTCYDTMPTYLNEAFSMAAEHLLLGFSSVQTRVAYFNYGKYSGYYQPGSALTYWSGSLSNYSNSYLFGQYLRTRYAQLIGDKTGNTFFRTVLEAWDTAEGKGDALQMIAGLLGTTEEKLIRDFWAAVYLREGKGDFGFNGEAWADKIAPPTVELAAGTSEAVQAGGCRYYTVPDGTANIESVHENLKLYAFADTPQVSVEAVSEGSADLFVRYRTSGTVCAAVYDDTSGQLLEFLLFSPSELCGELRWENSLLQTEGVTAKLLCLDENWQPCAGVVYVEEQE